MKKIIYCLLAVMALLAGGCATMNKQECEVADWYAIGYQHGVHGQGTGKYKEYASDCADHSIKADFTAFKRGHRAGLDEYCSYDTGRNLGQNGSSYNAQCDSGRYPAFERGYHLGLEDYCNYDNGLIAGEKGAGLNRACNAYPAFGAGHEAGYARYEIRRSIASMEQELSDIDSQISAEQALIADSEALIISKDATVDERTQALIDIKLHREEIKKLRKARHQVEAGLSDLHMQLDGPGLR